MILGYTWKTLTISGKTEGAGCNTNMKNSGSLHVHKSYSTDMSVGNFFAIATKKNKYIGINNKCTVHLSHAIREY